VAFEIITSLRFAIDSLFNLGSLGELSRRVPQVLAEAERRGDLYGATDMRTGLPNTAWLVMDDPATAAAECERGGDCLSRLVDFSSEHYFELLARTHIDLYTGDGEAAHRRMMETWPKLERSMLLRVQFVRVIALSLRGQAGLAAAAAGRGERRARLLAEVDRVRRRLEREPPRGADARADLLAAGAARLRGDVEQAVVILAGAESRFHTAEMELCAAAARYRRGELIGGAEGEKLRAESRRWMEGETIGNPTAMVRVVCSF